MINIRPTDSGDGKRAVPDINGQVIKVLPSDPLTSTHYHRLDRKPEGMIEFKKSGFVTSYFEFDPDYPELVTIHRTNNSELEVIVF